MTDVTSLLTKLDTYEPLSKYHFGHTPLQMSSFKTTQQHGCETYEYWHQVLQLRSLRDTLEDMQIQRDELNHDLSECSRAWPFWSYKSRKKKVPRLKFQLKKLDKTIAEKSREAEFHYELLNTRYKHLEGLSEKEILEKDSEYWVHRLRKQVVVSRLSRQVGVGEGELSAILALPLEARRQVLQGLEENKLLLDE